MIDIQKKYIVDEDNKMIGVQIDTVTFERMEEALENYGLVQLMKENENDDVLDFQQGQEYYKTLSKAE
ncbi:MAG: hypothetical protein AAB071_03885 [Bacteroidota bacterium]